MQKLLLSDLGAFAKLITEALSPKQNATIVALQGDLGAGKTTFVQALGKELGVVETIQSPTYVLMKSYEIKKVSPFTKFIHIDAYRLEDSKEFAALRPEQFLQDPKALVVVEWPEKVAGVLPPADMTINFSSDGAKEVERYIEVV